MPRIRRIPAASEIDQLRCMLACQQASLSAAAQRIIELEEIAGEFNMRLVEANERRDYAEQRLYRQADPDRLERAAVDSMIAG